MSDLGQLLKKARQERGITLEQLQETTKIRVRYLEAIEEENFSVLPGNFYVRAFIKSYAEAVGMDPEEVIRMYQNVIPSSQSEVKVDTIRPQTRARTNPNTDRIARWASTLLVLSFFVLIFMIIYHFVLSKDGEDQNIADGTPIVQNVDPSNGSNDVEPEPEPETEQETEQEPPVEPEKKPEPVLTFAATDGSTHVYTITNAEGLKLELSLPGGSCWVQVKQGGSSGTEISQKTYAKDQTDVWEVEDSLYVRLGNPRAVQLKVNGIEVEPEKFLADNPINFQFNLVKPTAP